jgi:hypothetical protein
MLIVGIRMSSEYPITAAIRSECCEAGPMTIEIPKRRSTNP